jgi:hypothetical protein
VLDEFLQRVLIIDFVDEWTIYVQRVLIDFVDEWTIYELDKSTSLTSGLFMCNEFSSSTSLTSGLFMSLTNSSALRVLIDS